MSIKTRSLSSSMEAVNEPKLATFAQWLDAYQVAPPEERTSMEEAGVRAARQWREAMHSLIQTDPKRALEISVPPEVRKELPPAVNALLEKRISAHGDYSVLAAIPLPGKALTRAPLERFMDVDGSHYKAFVYGSRVEALTKKKIPFHGIAVDNVLAVHEDAARPLTADARVVAEATKPADAICGVSQEPVNVVQEATPVEVGEEVVWLCRNSHIAELNEQYKLAAQRIGAAGGSASVDGDPAETPYTEGRKRLIMFRVAFSNLPTPDITSNSLSQTVLPAINTFWQINSYGRTTVAEPGRGSDIIQVTLNTNYQAFDDNPDAFRSAVRAAAVAQGVDFSKYDFDIIYSGSGRPAFDFGGLGYVGGPGSWVVGASRGITAHELGHNLGFPHANFWDTSGASANGPGQNQEYGDPFDVMGGGGIDDGTGPGHYVSKFKWRIGWLTDAEFPRLTSSATVRLYTHDSIDSRGIRGVRFARDGSLDYFLEFRQRYTANRWLMNGVGLRWGSPSGSSSQLIDVTPGTPDGKNDSAIQIGRTFSDGSVHITPLGFGNTYPQSIDVRVNIGNSSTNQPPVLRLAASTLETSPGGLVLFNANATDPNGDALACAWDFGDGSSSTSNTLSAGYAFSAAGEYVVRCTVSDMKGGSVSDSVTIRVGQPATFTISGRVLYKGKPIPDVLVRASSSRYAYTDSDGVYQISRLPAGSYTVNAQLYPYTFVNPFFSNPVSVGPDAENIDFSGVDLPQNDAILVPKGSTWKYLDNGSNQGTAWYGPAFNDTAWASGPAELGYGDTDEATAVGFGPDPNNKYITTYFRKSFVIPDPTTLTNYLLTLLSDDGGVVYLNGLEVLRGNMPTGTITYTTPAAGNSEEGENSVTLSASQFVAGNNVLAVEVHQVNATSSDMSFDLSLVATSSTNLSGINAFYIAQPSDGARFTTPATVNIRANGYSTSDSYDLVEFFANGTAIGSDNSSPFELAWPAAEGAHRLTSVATLSSGERLTSSPVNITVSAPVTQVTLISDSAVWRYNDENVSLGGAWTGLSYSDNTWSNGPAPLGFGDTGLASTLRSGPSNARIPTYYFRKTFTLEDAALVTNLIARLYRDDGAVLYLNGTEVARVLMPSTAITFTTLATAGVDGADETTPVVLSLPPSLLHDGVNVLAAEIHQNSTSSSDARFGLELLGWISQDPQPGIRITAPVGGTSFRSGEIVAVSATAVGVGVTNVVFYRDGVEFGADTDAPYQASLQENFGTFALTAVAQLFDGSTMASAPVGISFTAPPSGRQLVSSRALWRYLDDGSDPGLTWTSRTFNDGGWAQGYSRLGYGNDGESTTVSFGPDSAKRYLTTYFRHSFAVTNPAQLSRLRMMVSRDDGVVVYLNGLEIYRNNLAAGTVSYNSLALSTVDRPDETNYVAISLPTTGLLAGTNVISAEVHQSSLASSDLGFDLTLVGEVTRNASEGVYITAPAENARITLPASVDLGAFAYSSEADITSVQFYANDSLVGQDSSYPYNSVWSNPSVGNYVLTAIAQVSSGGSLTSSPVQVTVQGPPILIASVVSTLIPFNASWKYWSNAPAPPSDWKATEYDDTAWSSGQARLGFGLDGENTTLPSGRTTYYFRRSFNVPNPALVEDLIVQLRRDDGAVVYVNGVEIVRSNMPAGIITSTTFASADATGLDEQQAFITVVPGVNLLTGTNIIAVEVHQVSAASSDIGFDLHLSGSGDTAPRVVLSKPGNGAAIVVPNPVAIEAAPSAGQGRSVSKVEFFANGVLLGEATSAPYVFIWNDPAQGTHSLTARMTDNFGDMVVSRPTSITVGYEVVQTTFIAAGSVWKYLDTGVNLGTSWAQRSFNDSTWASGPAQLGYGDGDEATVVSFGPSSNAKYITTYFRRTFIAPQNVIFTNLTFRLLRDDGAVVWLNDREQFRSNMPSGAITSATVASSSVGDGPNESTFFPSSFTITNVAPTNLVAVEIHQSGGGSSDISFDLEVLGIGYILPIPALKIVNQGGPVQISWPAPSTGWNLFRGSSLDGNGTWSAVPGAPTVSGGRNTMTIPEAEAPGFYRLQR